MRKFLRNSLLEIFQTMYGAHKSIKDLINKKDYESARIVLGDCQNTAIQLGEAIESSEGEGFVTISYLEEYCEMIYSVFTSISDEYNGNKAKKDLDRALIKAENSVKNDIKVKLEIVFLPYKASMFDSLESVWKAANDDPDCNAHVIPIPYYDRKPDGSFGEMHYEGAEFPDYVPIVHYHAYDLEKMRPDVIYIHNPYDEYNFVTSVMECFYSSKIKKYTDKLVYIPYFVSPELDPDNELALKQISRFVFTPGVINADEVILQSEAMKQAYVKILLKQQGDTAENRKKLDKKILGIGSPKFDKVTQTNDFWDTIPDSWKRVIIKKDGSRKKVVFYNTSLSSLLQDTPKMIGKIRNVIEYFKEKSEDYVLLWRPHPLMKATLSSMRNMYSLEYDSIVNEFIESKAGIFDDTPTFHMAFSLSDAYYGDGSSLVPLYQATGKPLLVQNTEILNYCQRRPIPSALFADEEYIWFAARDFNGLYRVKHTDNKADYLGKFPNEKNESFKLYSDIALCNNKLFFAPYLAENIAYYDIEASEFHTISFDTSQSASEIKFTSAIVVNQYVFMYGYKHNTIIRINAQNDEIAYYKVAGSNANGEAMVTAGQEINGLLYFFSPVNDAVLCLNPDTMQGDFIITHCGMDKNERPVGHGMLIAKGSSGNYIYLDPKDMKVKKVQDAADIGLFCDTEKYLVYFSWIEKFVYRYEKNTHSIVTLPIEDFVGYCCRFGENILFSTVYKGEIFLFSPEKMSVTRIDNHFEIKQLQEIDMQSILNEHTRFNGQCNETAMFNLDSLLMVCKNNTNAVSETFYSNGEKIHKKVIGEALR